MIFLCWDDYENDNYPKKEIKTTFSDSLEDDNE